MSRTGKKPIQIPDKVKVSVKDGVLLAEGPMGKEQVELHAKVDVAVTDKQVQVNLKHAQDLESSKYHGMIRALVSNAIRGVHTGFTKELEINGVGYRAEVKGKVLNLALGFSHPVEYAIPEGITIKVDKQTSVSVSGTNRELVGRTSAQIREYRPPEPYKGKGVKYKDEHIIRKVGKAAGGK